MKKILAYSFLSLFSIFVFAGVALAAPTCTLEWDHPLWGVSSRGYRTVGDTSNVKITLSGFTPNQTVKIRNTNVKNPLHYVQNLSFQVDASGNYYIYDKTPVIAGEYGKYTGEYKTTIHDNTVFQSKIVDCVNGSESGGFYIYPMCNLTWDEPTSGGLGVRKIGETSNVLFDILGLSPNQQFTVRNQWQGATTFIVENPINYANSAGLYYKYDATPILASEYTKLGTYDTSIWGNGLTNIYCGSFTLGAAAAPTCSLTWDSPTSGGLGVRKIGDRSNVTFNFGGLTTGKKFTIRNLLQGSSFYVENTENTATSPSYSQYDNTLVSASEYTKLGTYDTLLLYEGSTINCGGFTLSAAAAPTCSLTWDSPTSGGLGVRKIGDRSNVIFNFGGLTTGQKFTIRNVLRGSSFYVENTENTATSPSYSQYDNTLVSASEYTQLGTFDTQLLYGGSAPVTCGGFILSAASAPTPAPAPNLKLSTVSSQPLTYKDVDGPVLLSNNAYYTLSWSVANATECKLDSLPVSTSGTTNNLQAYWGFTDFTKTHTLTCTGPGGSGSDTLTVKVPPPPTNLQKSCDSTGTKMTLSWTLPTSGSYTTAYFHANTDPDPTNFVAESRFTENYAKSPYTFTVVPGTSYHVWAQTHGPMGEWSNNLSGVFSCSAPSVTPKPDLLVSPTSTTLSGAKGDSTKNFNIVVSNIGNADLNWVASVDSASSSWCKITTPNSGTIVTGGGSQVFIMGIDPIGVKGDYTCTITVKDKIYTSISKSSMVYYTDNTVSVTKPATPTGFVASPSGCKNNWLNLSWNASSGATNYKVYRNGTTLVYDGSGLAFSDLGLTFGATYSYTLVASNSAGSSSAATTNGTVSSACPVDVPAPTSFTVDKCLTTDSQVTFRYTLPSGYTKARLLVTNSVGGTIIDMPNQTFGYIQIANNSGVVGSSYIYKLYTQDASNGYSTSFLQLNGISCQNPSASCITPSAGTINAPAASPFKVGFEVSCDFGVENAYITMNNNNGDCAFMSWANGKTGKNTLARFSCLAPNVVTTKTYTCTLNNLSGFANICTPLPKTVSSPISFVSSGYGLSKNTITFNSVVGVAPAPDSFYVYDNGPSNMFLDWWLMKEPWNSSQDIDWCHLTPKPKDASQEAKYLASGDTFAFEVSADAKSVAGTYKCKISVTDTNGYMNSGLPKTIIVTYNVTGPSCQNPTSGTIGTPSSVTSGDAFNVSCDYGVYDSQITVPGCNWTSWVGTTANFTCVAPTVTSPTGQTYTCTPSNSNPSRVPFCSLPVSKSANVVIMPKPTVPTPKPNIQALPVSLNFSAEKGTAPSTRQKISITNTGTATLNWTVSTNKSWCYLYPSASGSRVASLNGSIAQNLSSDFWVGVGAMADAGTYNCEVTISDPNATNNPRTVNVNYTVTNTSVPTVQYTLTVGKTNNGGSGTIVSTPAGINCGSTCSAKFSAGQTITITATPNGNSKLRGWKSSGACGGTTANTCTIIMDGDKTANAVFIEGDGSMNEK